MDIHVRDVNAPRFPQTNETHVYVESLTDVVSFEELLTDSERARAERFRLQRIRDQFMAARGRLRLLLGHCLNLEPQRVPLLYADSGKPFLPEEHGLHFNVSHTEGLALFALSGSRVGIDVERDRIIPDASDLVRRFFAKRECEEFMRLPPEARNAAFLRAWTRKEAVLKAMGRGVQSLDYCEVSFAESEMPCVRCLDGDASAGERWHLHAWQPQERYHAVVAVENL